MTELKELIARNLKKYRQEAGLSQVELAEKLHIRSSSVSNWENGRNSIDIDTLFRVSKILGVSINQMIDTEKPVCDSFPEPEIKIKLDDETEVFIELIRKMPPSERTHLMRYYEYMMSRTDLKKESNES